MEEFSKIKKPEELLEYMDTITYGFLGKNGKKYYNMCDEWIEQCIVQSPEEVIKSKIGTCFDQVELERLWFKNNNYIFKTFFIWFEVNRPNTLPTHTFLIFERNNKFYWFEHSFEMYRGIHEFDSIDEAILFIEDKQFEYALMNNSETRLTDKNCLECYEYEKPEDDLKVNDFISYVTTNKYKSRN